MRSKASSIAPIFRSDAQGRLLARIMLNGEGLTLSDLAAATGLPLTTVQREMRVLEDAGVVRTRKVGRARVVTMDESYPLLAPLSEIVAATYGPAPVIAEEFGRLEGAGKVIIYGSWAARSVGRSGRFPADIDVLVIGDADRLEAIEHAMRASDSVGRDVNVTVVDVDRWESATDGFICDIQSKPYVLVSGG